MLKVLRALAVIIIGFLCGVIGLVLGALIGGNFAQGFIFNGVQGYEAAGQVGFYLGALAGIIFSGILLFKRKAQPAH